ncbi:MAG: family 20 glycosylhydrolase [Clostridia bacterium]|nr:family 20 glycosylhydrolase [Clostridia bacterium]
MHTFCAAVYSVDFPAEAKAFAELVCKLHSADVKTANGGVMLSCDGTLSEGEYRISCSDKGLFAYASERKGAGYALTTLVQLISFSDNGLMCPEVEIQDRPDRDHRALMIDLARKWHPFPVLLEYVDLCRLYKINYLHLHFADNESYTLPSSELPRLSTPDRSYTAEEIGRLVAYAEERGVELIPEIEAPGHAKAMILAYPELFGHVGNDPDKLCDRLICVGKPGISETLSRWVDEVIALFPHSRYLHIGGDEARIHAWNACDDCRAYMKTHCIEDEYALYTHFIKLMTDLVIEKGRTPLVWEGFPRKGAEALSRETVVSVFESLYHTSPELLCEGFKMINSSWQPLYIVPRRHWSAEYIYEWNIFRWENWWEKSKAYEKPIEIPPSEQVLGGELCAWGCTYGQEIGLVRENLAALAERTWNVTPIISTEDFRRSLNAIIPIAEKLTVSEVI